MYFRVVVLWRWVYTKCRTLPKVQSGFMESRIFKLSIPLITRKIRGMAEAQGMGRHTKHEVIEMGLKDLKAISAYLGKKPYFTGETPTELDCAMFGSLAQVLWNMPSSPYESLFEGRNT